ncbi:MAG: preprotein translocase subunit SecG [Candidatus Nealsonbacteria bacterium RBG_13_42_11]|uniref:Protein-export membrane protein SecG n=1 Tax=Candidatus Nealsonbacteria bacterium RBG_13_42_11 TaxID=1801663 RepID=A0A1G2DYU2_9BACT|nr:MAG: preprotein translocase subunit SecG [Candidatus Nealsonbacteria bacterium RBG_13_42_11]
MLQQYLPLFQIVISILLIILIMLQQRGTALGSAFGQEGGFYATRRGIQKKLFWATVACGTLFIVSSLLNLLF